MKSGFVITMTQMIAIAVNHCRGCYCKRQKNYDIDLKESVMIGDRWKDIEAGQAAGCKTIWINHSYQEPGT